MSYVYSYMVLTNYGEIANKIFDKANELIDRKHELGIFETKRSDYRGTKCTEFNGMYFFAFDGLPHIKLMEWLNTQSFEYTQIFYQDGNMDYIEEIYNWTHMDVRKYNE